MKWRVLYDKTWKKLLILYLFIGFMHVVVVASIFGANIFELIFNAPLEVLYVIVAYPLVHLGIIPF